MQPLWGRKKVSITYIPHLLLSCPMHSQQWQRQPTKTDPVTAVISYILLCYKGETEMSHLTWGNESCLTHNIKHSHEKRTGKPWETEVERTNYRKTLRKRKPQQQRNHDVLCSCVKRGPPPLLYILFAFSNIFYTPSKFICKHINITKNIYN